jgi:hypothetical protein
VTTVVLSALALLVLLGVGIAVVGYMRWRWLMAEEARALAADTNRTMTVIPGVTTTTTARTITVTITIDTTAFDAAMRRASTAVQQMARNMAAATERFSVMHSNYHRAAIARLEDLKKVYRLERDKKVAGTMARVQVRAGLDPAYRDRDQLHQLVRAITAREGEYDWLTHVEALDVAAAAIRGWAESYTDPGPRPQLAYGRHLGGAYITVVSP